MLIEVLCVCRRPPRWVSDVAADYAKRLPQQFRLEFSYLAAGPDKVSSAVRSADEAERVLKRVAGGTPLIALDVDGCAGSSEQFAARLRELRDIHQKIVIAIGGADGHGAAVTERASARWSLSPLTLPHLLVQVILAEQIYRAWTILEGHPYHRG